jgi:hypothetical protein
VSRFAWILAGALAVLLGLSYCSGRSGAAEAAAVARAEGHQAALDSLAPITEALTVRADSLAAEAFRLDTVLVTVTDTVEVRIDRAREAAAEASDSLRARIDSAATVFLDHLEAAHSEEVAAWQTLADERLAWGLGWMETALAKDSALISTQHQLRIALTWAESVAQARGSRARGARRLRKDKRMKAKITIDYDSDLKRVHMERPKSAALALEALAMAIQAIAETDVKGREKSDSGIRVARTLPTPRMSP